MKKGFFSNWIVRNVLLAAGAVLGLILVINLILALLTRHNQELTVPDFTGCTLSQAREMSDRSLLRIEVSDSVFVRNVKKGVVFSQNPKAGSKVKKGRRVFLTTNAVCAKKVSMPSLVGCSMRQARAELLSRGLVPGRLQYVPDIATNNVLGQKFNGSDIEPGAILDAGSSIDLLLGLNEDDCCTFVPDLTGFSYQRATDLVQESSLNVGRIIFDSSIKTYSDSLNAVVVSQSPEHSEFTVLMGTRVSFKLQVPER